ncbi:MAG TPA: tail fiber protein [Candidatus Limnocylindrales bacterium]|nr:tail fiber protein [Candidatus Limnocylindrales bacterium]
MGTPYVGEIRMFAGNFAPVGWAFCNGATLAISENDVLFNLIGTTYGGDGQNTFNLPNLASRVPVHVGPGFVIGQSGGVESVTLTTSQIPAHSHVPLCNSGAGTNASPQNDVWAALDSNVYSDAAPSVTMAAQALGSAGGSQPHDNMVPFLCINFIISLFGIFPSQT